MCQFLAGYFLAFYRSWQISVVLLGTVPLLLLGMFFLIAAIVSIQRAAATAFGDAGAVAEETLSNMATVYALNAQNLQSPQLHKIFSRTLCKQGENIAEDVD